MGTMAYFTQNLGKFSQQYLGTILSTTWVSPQYFAQNLGRLATISNTLPISPGNKAWRSKIPSFGCVHAGLSLAILMSVSIPPAVEKYVVFIVGLCAATSASVLEFLEERATDIPRSRRLT